MALASIETKTVTSDTDSPKVPSALKEASPASSARVKLWSG